MDISKSIQKKKGRQNIFMKLRVHTRLCVLCVKVGGGMSHNKGLTMNKDGGVWEQEIESTCGKRRIYTAFLEGKLVTRFKASAP